MKRHFFRTAFFLIALTALLVSCDPDKADVQVDPGLDYYPLQLGKTMIYTADSVIYDPQPGGVQVDTHSYFIREVIVDTFSNQAGERVFVWERSERDSLHHPWEVRLIWSAVLSGDRLIRSESNLRLNTLLFPPLVGRMWEAAAAIAPGTIVTIAGEGLELFKSWGSVILSEGEPQRIGDRDYDRVLTVSHADDENLIELRYFREWYARGTGLVRQDIRILDTQCIAPCSGQPFEEKAEKGFILRKTLIDQE